MPDFPGQPCEERGEGEEVLNRFDANSSRANHGLAKACFVRSAATPPRAATLLRRSHGELRSRRLRSQSTVLRGRTSPLSACWCPAQFQGRSAASSRQISFRQSCRQVAGAVMDEMAVLTNHPSRLQPPGRMQRIGQIRHGAAQGFWSWPGGQWDQRSIADGREPGVLHRSNSKWRIQYLCSKLA
jgi:hypothetical protein